MHNQYDIAVVTVPPRTTEIPMSLPTKCTDVNETRTKDAATTPCVE